MKKTTLLSMLLLCSLFSRAQESTEQFKHDIGFNTNFLFQGILGSTTPFSLMYKTYITENTAWRLGTDFNVNIDRNDSKYLLTNYTDQSSIFVSLSVGKEWQKSINKSWTWYHGTDLIPFLNYNDQKYYTNQEIKQSYMNSAIGINVRPFLGIRYAINSRLYVSAEANLSLQYARAKKVNKQYNPDVTSYDSSGNKFMLNASPAYGLFVYYRF
jgi:hypothetical protein